MNIDSLEKSIKGLEGYVSSLKGQLSLLEEQYANSTEKLSELKELQVINIKAVELLNFVQKVTRDLIKDTFETIVSNALKYIHQDNNYNFSLIFDKRGNLPELKFCVKTPEMQEAHDILVTRGGGSNDIISLALRFVLLEVSKMKGFIFLDEPEKCLDSPETLEKMIEFVKEMQKETKRQIFWITHKEEVVSSVKDPIILTDRKSNNIKVDDVASEVKKRGRKK